MITLRPCIILGATVPFLAPVFLNILLRNYQWEIKAYLPDIRDGDQKEAGIKPTDPLLRCNAISSSLPLQA